MAKNDNAHAKRLSAAIADIVSPVAATSLAERFPLASSADVIKKAHWACEICQELQDRYGDDKAAQIRRSCRCGDGRTMAQEIAACIVKGGGLAAGCVLFSQKKQYAFLEYVSENEVLFGYHHCVCSCVKRTDTPIPSLWCECSVGYVEAMFRQLFNGSVRVELVGSAKSGAKRCSFRIQR